MSSHPEFLWDKTREIVLLTGDDPGSEEPEPGFPVGVQVRVNPSRLFNLQDYNPGKQRPLVVTWRNSSIDTGEKFKNTRTDGKNQTLLVPTALPAPAP